MRAFLYENGQTLLGQEKGLTRITTTREVDNCGKFGQGTMSYTRVTVAGNGPIDYAVISVIENNVFVIDNVIVKTGPAVKCAGRRATKLGTPRPDRITGTSKRDVIVGFQGNDVIAGLGGRDIICGGPGNDTIRGGGGGDRLFGNGGIDRLHGNGGPDFMNGGTDDDTCKGGPGGDIATQCEVVASVP